MAAFDTFAEVEHYIQGQLNGLEGRVCSYSVTDVELLRLTEAYPDFPSDLIIPEVMSALLPLSYFRTVRTRGRLVNVAGFKTVITPPLSDDREYPQLVITSAILNYLTPIHAERYVRQKVKLMERTLGNIGFFPFHRQADVFAERYSNLPVLTLELVTGEPGQDVMVVVLPPGRSNGSGMVRWLPTSEEARKAWQLPSISSLWGLASDTLQRRFEYYRPAIDALVSAVAGQYAAGQEPLRPLGLTR